MTAEKTSRLVVLASGSGTNLQALLDRFNLGDDDVARVVRVVASRPGVGALDRAEEAGVPGSVLPEEVKSSTGSTAGTGTRPGLEPSSGSPGLTEEGRVGDHDLTPEESWLLTELDDADADLVILAGYLRKIPPAVVNVFRDRIVNVHPALLPSFGGKGMYGLNVHRTVLERGVRVTGVTVHLVDEEYDRGPILAQWPVPVRQGDDPEKLASRVLEVEHRVLPEVVSALASGRVRRDADGRIRWSPHWFDGERFTLE